MNKTFRLIWSAVREAWIVVSEKVTAKGGIPARTVAALAVVGLLAAGSAHALPQGGQVVGGSSSIGSPASGQMVISQSSQKSIINWQSYGIAAGEKVQYIQPSSSAISLNRVTGVDPTVIHGQLSANGNVWVINPNGLLIGSGARIDVGGFLGSTLNIGNEDFMNGNYRFRADRATPGSISNLGDITTTDGGYVMLIAPTVSNEGDITTNLGKSYLVSGNEVTLNFAGNDLIGFTVDKGVVNGETAGISNSGRISANGGEVILSAKSASNMLKSVVNNSGVIEARTVENRSGRIFLLGDMDSGTVNVGGTLDASAPSPLPSPTGGEGAETPLALDGRGVGGEGGADGGFIETSAAHVKVADGTVVTTKSENGQSGTWLIDPVDFTIAASGGDMTGATLTANLGGGNVTIQSTLGASGTAGDVNVNDTVTWSSNILTLNAQNDINLNAALNGSGTAGLALEYGQGAVAAGNTSTYNIHAQVNLASTGSFSTKLGSDGTVKNYTIITSLGSAGSTTGTDLQGMNGNKAGNYVLGADIDASATSGWNAGAGFEPVGWGAAGDNSPNAFSGHFDGLGHTISGLTINRPGSEYVGLFGFIGGANLRNVGLTGVAVTGSGIVGGLVGYSWVGSIRNAYVTGAVSGGGLVGGLLGYQQEFSSLSHSYASATVTGTGDDVGGLVGSNYASSTVSNSYATGAVTGNNNVGGLVGISEGGCCGFFSTISNSYATGAVTGGGINIGGLVGTNSGTAKVLDSYWDIGTTGQADGYGLNSGATITNLVGLATPYAYASYANFDFTNTWWMSDWNTRPFLRSEYSTTITNAHQLQLMDMNRSASYTLANDIDASETAAGTGMWAGAGFTPIAVTSSTCPLCFSGTFDGLGHVIDGLYINRHSSNYIGLFGYASGATLRNIGLVNAYVRGQSLVGSLVGALDAGSTVSDSYASSTVISTNSNSVAGGLIGLLRGTLTNSYAMGSVSGTNIVGGLVGANQAAGTITNSYATGTVNGSADVGGLVGQSSATVTASFWDTQTSGQATSAGGAGAVGKTSAEMKTLATFTGWDIDAVGGSGKVWRIYDGDTTPLLRGFLTPLNVTPDYDGSGAALGNVAAYTIADSYDGAKLLGAATNLTLTSVAADAYVAQIGGFYSNQQGYDLVGRTIASLGSAAGDVVIANPVTWTSGLLNVNAANDIDIRANLNGSGTAQLALEYGQGAVAAGNTSNYYVNNGAKVYLPAGANFSTKLGNNVAATPWTVITGLGVEGDATVAPGVMTLQGMNTDLAGNYVLGADIPASGTSTWNTNAGFAPVGGNVNFVGFGEPVFTGSFDGLGHTITGLTINNAGTDLQGLFGYNTGTLRNVGLLNSSISGRTGVGTLAGFSTGAISYSYADGGSVTGVGGGSNIGGLQGGGSGSISYSYANVSVSGSGSIIGGLKGGGSGTVSNSYATGSVYGGSGTDIGGLVGQTGGNITNSYATGAVTVADPSNLFNTVGGLVGKQTVGGTITNSYWDKVTTGQTTSSGSAAAAGKTTAEMKQLATFAAWDIDDAGGTGKVWRIYEGNTAPLLKSFLTPLTVTANNATTTYSGTAYSGGNGVTKSDPAAVLLGSATYGGTSQGAINVGGYTIVPGGYYSNQQGYDITFANGTLTINPAPLSLLSVTANTIAKTYGTAYTFNGTEFTPVGLQGGDTIGSVTLTSAGAPASAPVGSYAIVPSNATGGTFNPANYSISYVNGTLTVNPAPLAVTANNALKTYDGLTWSGSNGVSYSGFVNGENTTALGGSLNYTGSSQGAKNAGSYSITPSGLTSGNYSIAFNDGTLTINKADAIVTANSGSTVYNGLLQNVTGFTASGLVGGETASVLTGITTSGGTATNAGTYAHTIGGTDGNYNLTFVDGSLIITPAPLAVTANNASKTYDGLAYSGGNGVSYSGFVNNETEAVLGGSLSYGGSSQGAKNANSYVITPSGLTSGNYTISYHNGTLSVAPAQLEIRADAQTKLYANPDPELTYGAIGLQAADTAASVLSGNLTREPGEVLGSYAIEQGSLVSNGNYLLSFSGNALTIRPNQSYEEARAAGFQAKTVVTDAPKNVAAGQLFTVDYDSFKAWQSAALPLSEK